jgi:hypothetical protein
MDRKKLFGYMEFYNHVNKILWEKWDPIGLSGYADSPRDEYYSYLPHVYHLALTKSDPKEIAEYLLLVEKEMMGLSGSENNCQMVAELIIQEKEKLNL